jgi:hypothetical protein
MGLRHHCHLLVTTVNARAFYPSAKQRTRTTTQQLKILEATFKSNMKPSVNHRQKLALKIDMTPRSVQVCL